MDFDAIRREIAAEKAEKKRHNEEIFKKALIEFDRFAKYLLGKFKPELNYTFNQPIGEIPSVGETSREYYVLNQKLRISLSVTDDGMTRYKTDTSLSGSRNSSDKSSDDFETFVRFVLSQYGPYLAD